MKLERYSCLALEEALLFDGLRVIAWLSLPKFCNLGCLRFKQMLELAEFAPKSGSDTSRRLL